MSEEEKKQFTDMKTVFRQAMDVDLLLFMDCTSSMGDWIEEAKKILIKLIDDLVKRFKGFTFRVAFVGYRDFCDKN